MSSRSPSRSGTQHPCAQRVGQASGHVSYRGPRRVKWASRLIAPPIVIAAGADEDVTLRSPRDGWSLNVRGDLGFLLLGRPGPVAADQGSGFVRNSIITWVRRYARSYGRWKRSTPPSAVSACVRQRRVAMSLLMVRVLLVVAVVSGVVAGVLLEFSSPVFWSLAVAGLLAVGWTGIAAARGRR